MYESFYNLNCSAFQNTADPRFFFASEHHREALAAIEYTIRLNKGLVLITGEPGSGKTTVANTLQARMGNDAQFLHMSNAHQTPKMMMRQIAMALGVSDPQSEDRVALLQSLRARLTEQIQQRQPIVLIIDEAQTLSNAALEELRLLTNMDTATRKLAQIVLIGQPEVLRRLGAPEHTSLRQRIFLSRRIKSFTLEETASYVTHRIRAASANPGQTMVEFTPGAIREIHRLTGGIARLINSTCDNCLLLGSVRQSREISTQIVHDVAADMVPRFDAVTDHTHHDQPDLSLAGNF